MNEPEKNKGLATRHASKVLSNIESLKDFERFVDFIANSDTYNVNFRRNVTGEDGKITRVIDRDGLSVCLMLGSELGFKPFESLVYGTKLNADAITKIHRGRDLGINAVSAMQNIYVWRSEDKEMVYTSIHVVRKVLIDNKITRKILEDGSGLFYIYSDVKTNEEVEYDTRFHTCINTNTPEEVKDAIANKKQLVKRIATRRAVVELTRRYDDGRDTEIIAIPYTLIQATDAGLYRGTNSQGEVVKGKNNWNSHPVAHLLKQSEIMGARIIAGDALQGVYIPEELPFAEEITEDTTAEEVK